MDMYKLGLGWKRDLPDSRDFIAKLKRAPGVDVSNIDLRRTDFFPEIYNQGRTNACTGFSIAAALEYGRRREKLSDFAPSKLFIYYNGRSYDGNSVGKDDGAQLRDGMKAIADFGATTETTWPFDETKVLTKPNDESFSSAKPNIIKQYSRILTTLKDVQAALSRGIPIIFGLFIFENFDASEVRENGIIAMPKGKHIGDHAMLIVGIKDKYIISRNSWGDNWGESGYCYIPFEYIFNDAWAGDLWVIDVAKG
jgi:C1A family cysteine protease